MTANPLQPISPRDGSMPRPGNATGSQSQSPSQSNPKSPQGANQRDDGARTFRSSSETGAASTSRTGGSAEVLGYLNSITEFVEKARKALSGTNMDESRQSSDRQASDRQGNERQSNEGGARTSHNEDAERTRDAVRPL